MRRNKRHLVALLWGIVVLFGGISLAQILTTPWFPAVIAVLAALLIPYILRDEWTPVLMAYWRNATQPVVLDLSFNERPEFSFLLPETAKVKDKLPLFGYATLDDKEQFPLTLTLPLGQWIIMTQWVVQKQIIVQGIQSQLYFEPDNGAIRVLSQENPFVVRELNGGDYLDWHGNLNVRGSLPRAIGPNHCEVTGYRFEVTGACRAKLRFVVTVEGEEKIIHELEFFGVIIGPETMRSASY